MDIEEKLTLKIQALKERFYKREEELDDEIANLRVGLTALDKELQAVRADFEAYKSRHPEETDVPQGPEDDTQN